MLSRKESIALSFGKSAPLYDALAEPQKQIAAALAGLLPAVTAPDVLELGCGTGFFTKHLFGRYPGGRFLVTDISEDMLERCRANCGEGTYAFMDGDFPQKGPYDVIASSMAAQWFRHPSQSLRNLVSFLNPGGSVVYSALGPDSFPEWRDSLRNLGLPDGAVVPADLPGIVKEERFTLDYGCTQNFLRAMKTIGAARPREGYVPLHPAAFRRACALCDERHGGRITWHIVYGILSRPAL